LMVLPIPYSNACSDSDDATTTTTRYWKKKKHAHTQHRNTDCLHFYTTCCISIFLFSRIYISMFYMFTHTPYRTSKRKQQQQLHPMILPHTSYIYIYTLYIHYIYHIIHYMSIIANLLLHNAMHIYVISCIVPFHLQ